MVLFAKFPASHLRLVFGALREGPKCKTTRTRSILTIDKNEPRLQTQACNFAQFSPGVAIAINDDMRDVIFSVSRALRDKINVLLVEGLRGKLLKHST